MLEFLREKISFKNTKNERWIFIYNSFSYKVNLIKMPNKTISVQNNEANKIP